MRVASLIFILAGAYIVSYLAIDSSTFIHRRDFDHAFFEWYKKPTAENKAVLQKEQEKNRAIRMKGDAPGAAIVVSLGYGIYAFLGRLRKSQ
jgi:hypothetical protein